MGVAERDVGRLVPHAIGDCEGDEDLVDEQAHVPVTQIVYADLIDPRSSCSRSSSRAISGTW